MNAQFASNVILRMKQKWEVCGEGLLRGHFFYNGVLDNRDLLDDPRDITLLTSNLGSACGFFAIILPIEDGIILMADHIRSRPLYYKLSGKSIIVSDEPESIIKENVDKLSMRELLEFLCTGYVTGENTIFEGVKQIEAGTCIIFKDGEIAKHRYFDYRPNLEQTIDAASYHGAFENALDDAFRRLGAYSKGRQIAMPLSGGFDSRLIALYLRKFDFDNVITFSYGRPGNRDSEISKLVARELGYDWFFVPYSNETWKKVSLSRSWLDYCSYAFQLSSLPHLQDFPAIGSLLEQGVIEEDAMVTPGHRPSYCRDVFNDQEEISKDWIVRRIMLTNYRLWQYDAGSALHEEFYAKISGSLSDFTMARSNVAASMVDNWLFKEREAKFIAHSVSCYEHAGLDWWLPLLDQEFVSFWQKITFDCNKEDKCFRRSVHLLTQEIVKDADSMESPIQRIPPGPLAASRTERKTGSFLAARLEKAKNGLDMVLYNIGHSRERDYQDSPYAFFGLVDKKEFMRTYTGMENINSFIALNIAKQYLDPKVLGSPEAKMIQSIKIYKSNMWDYLKKHPTSVQK
jgi:asparagine synthase (glutamine-hydrolysing)